MTMAADIILYRRFEWGRPISFIAGAIGLVPYRPSQSCVGLRAAICLFRLASPAVVVTTAAIAITVSEVESDTRAPVVSRVAVPITIVKAWIPVVRRIAVIVGRRRRGACVERPGFGAFPIVGIVIVLVLLDVAESLGRIRGRYRDGGFDSECEQLLGVDNAGMPARHQDS